MSGGRLNVALDIDDVDVHRLGLLFWACARPFLLHLSLHRTQCTTQLSAAFSFTAIQPRRAVAAQSILVSYTPGLKFDFSPS